MTMKSLDLEKVGEEIEKELAAKMVKDFHDANPADVKSYYIGKNIIEKMLSQPNCVGIKFYNALNEAGEKTLVYVGIDQNAEIISEVTYVNDLGRIERHPGIVADRVVKEVPEEGFGLGYW